MQEPRGSDCVVKRRVYNALGQVTPPIRNVVLVTPEAEPFYRKGGLGNVCGELAAALSRAGLTTHLVTGWYESMQANPPPCIEGGVSCSVAIGPRKYDMSVLRGVYNGVTHCFLSIPGLIREAYEGSSPLDFALALCEGAFRAIESMVHLGLMERPDILHAHDWPTALVPVFLRAKYGNNPVFQQTASVLTVHNAKHMGGWIPGHRFPDLGISGEHWPNLEQPGEPDKFCLLRGGVRYAHKLNAVSRTNREEMLTPFGGFGLERDYLERANDFAGIVNGISYDEWPSITPEDKARAKTELQKQFGFECRKQIPLLGMVARIDKQKGVKLAAAVIGRLLERTKGGLQFVYLGQGHPMDPYAVETSASLDMLAQRWPRNVRFVRSYSTAEQKAVFRAIDIFLYPSEFEPCGTRPVVALRHRVPCVVTRTGGLADNFTEYNPITGEGNGWLLEAPREDELERAIERALALFKQRKHWARITANAAAADHSWDRPVHEYIRLYAEAAETARNKR